MNGNPNYSERSLRAIILELKEEVAEFVQTRVQILTGEARMIGRRLAMAIPFALVGALFVGIGIFLFVIALVAVIAFALGADSLAWFYGFLIVGGFAAIVGGIALLLARSEFKHAGLPKKTLEVLRQDKLWLQKETEA